MTDRAILQAELLALCGKVRDHTVTPGDAARLDELLQADDAAKVLYVRYMSVVSLLESRGLGQRIDPQAHETAEAIDENVFDELLQLESQAEVELIKKPKKRGLMTKPVMIGAAAAAIVAVALILYVVFGGGTSESPTTDDPAVGDASVGKPVATLTDVNDARWLSAGIAVGEQLSSGQKLELVRGFAEITTLDGAVVILEAPAKIEFTDNENAVHLHAGKLIAVCKTDTSKGLVVKTPHMDITDLSTEFGVMVTDAEVAATVFVGKIEVAPSEGKPRQLTTGQTARLSVDADRLALKIDQQVPAGFDALREQQFRFVPQLVASGEGLSRNDLDPQWRLTAIDGKALQSSLPMRVSGFTSPTRPDPLAPAKMLVHIPTHGRSDTVYRIETTTQIPERFDPFAQQLELRFRVDNELLSLTVNGQAVQLPEQNANAFARDYTMLIDGPLRKGDNSFVFEVRNAGANTPDNPAGLQVALKLVPRNAQAPE